MYCNDGLRKEHRITRAKGRAGEPLAGKKVSWLRWKKWCLWQSLIDLIEPPAHPNDEQKGGRPPYPLGHDASHPHKRSICPPRVSSDPPPAKAAFYIVTLPLLVSWGSPEVATTSEPSPRGHGKSRGPKTRWLTAGVTGGIPSSNSCFLTASPACPPKVGKLPGRQVGESHRMARLRPQSFPAALKTCTAAGQDPQGHSCTCTWPQAVRTGRRETPNY